MLFPINSNWTWIENRKWNQTTKAVKENKKKATQDSRSSSIYLYHSNFQTILGYKLYFHRCRTSSGRDDHRAEYRVLCRSHRNSSAGTSRGTRKLCLPPLPRGSCCATVGQVAGIASWPHLARLKLTSLDLKEKSDSMVCIRNKNVTSQLIRWYCDYFRENRLASLH